MSRGRAGAHVRMARQLLSASTLAVTLTLAASAARLPGLDAVAGADAIGNARAKAARIAGQREQLTQEAERLNEQANAAQDELTKVEADLATTRAKLAEQRSIADALHTQAADLAVQSYMRGDITSGIGTLVSDTGATDLQLRQGYAPVALGHTSDVLDQARAATQDTERLSGQLDAMKAAQTRLLGTIAARRASIEKTQTQLAALAEQVSGDLARLVAEEEARKAAEAEAAAAAKAKAEEAARLKAAQQAEAARQLAVTQASQAAAQAAAAAAARTAAARAAAAPGAPAAGGAPVSAAPKGSSKTTAPPAPRATAPPAGNGEAAPPPAAAPPPDVPDLSNYPAPSPAAAVAVAEALRQLGKPYVFGTAGPDTFDCSGLMMWAWAKAGVSMPHYTVSQYNAFPHVPLSEVAPGDLVFFNVNLGHVGMYIGGGQYVQAPRSRDVVKISSLTGRTVVGVVRPG